MRCHYEVLEVSREAEDSEIKNAYRKLALKWHPDKNPDDAEFAKEQFQIVQQAYEVLSDKQERAWYDQHREQILCKAKPEFEDNSLDVFQYFTTSCFKGYGDDENGFYTVYRNVFEQIAQEDLQFVDDSEPCEVPNFGSSSSDYEDVVRPFYDYWISYMTKKTYFWLEPYDIREGKRWMLKKLDKENKKVRQKAKSQRNEEVRNLVLFVRKRDKRVQLYKQQMEEQTLENKKKREILNRQKRMEQKEKQANEVQAEWLKFDNVKSELEEIERHLAKEFGEEMSNSEEEQDINNLYCIACNKLFKNPKAFENHESSKKHRENVEKLKKTMRENDAEYSDNTDEYKEEIDISIEEKSTQSDSDSLDIQEISDGVKETNQIKRKNRKSKNVIVHALENDEDLIGMNNVISSDDEFSFDTTKKQRKKNKKTNNTPKPKQEIDAESLATGNGEDIVNISKKSTKGTHSVNIEEIDIGHCCVTCKNIFPSKNKLFDHLKKTGHGVHIPSKTKLKKKAVKN